MAGLLNQSPYGGGLLGNPLQAGLLGQNALTSTYSQPNNVDRFLGGLTRLPFAIAEGIGNRVMQAHEAMPWGGNNPQAIGYDPQAGTIDPSVMIPFATDVAGMATTGSLAAPAVRNATGMGIRAYHGSPHDFDRFSMDKIGTGEGAQAYGHGLYFAENEAVSRGYRDALSSHEPTLEGQPFASSREYWQAFDDLEKTDWRQAKILDEFTKTNGTRDDRLREIRNWYRADPEMTAAIDRMEARLDTKSSGRMYEVDINASPDEFLDWDKPLSEQPEVMARLSKSKRKAVQNLLAQERFADLSKSRELYGRELGPLTGEDLIKALSLDLEGRTIGAKSGEALRAAGIKGIRYKDAGSRGADAAGGTSNFVVFDDNIIEILKKYGIAGLTAGGAGAAMLGGTQDASASPTSYSTGGRF